MTALTVNNNDITSQQQDLSNFKCSVGNFAYQRFNNLVAEMFNTVLLHSVIVTEYVRNSFVTFCQRKN